MATTSRVTVRDEWGNYSPVSEHSDISLPRTLLRGDDVIVIESCNSTWVFDEARARFRRVPRGSKLDFPLSAADWETFHGLELLPATGAIVVRLNEAGTNLLRAYRHTDPCPHCAEDPDPTSQLTLSSADQT